MTNPQDNAHAYQATCAACGRLWTKDDVATEVHPDGQWRHHDCRDPKLEVTVR